MGDILVLTEADLRTAVGLGADELATIESVYGLISDGVAVMPPILRLDVVDHHGEVDVKTAYLPGHPGIAIKVSAGFFDNPAKGLPSLGGLMVVLDAVTGIPTAALFDNGYLTDLRTGLAGAVAADHLARPDAERAAILGAGTQARYQLRALRLVRPIRSVTFWSRRPERARDISREFTGEMEVEVATTPAEAVATADIVVTTTPATEPLIETSMLHPGLHVTAVGSDAEHKQELGAGVVEAADVFAVDSRSQSGRLGELRAAIAAGADTGRVVELGDVIGRRVGGREGAGQVTVCDLTGTGAQDTAIAGLAVERCRALGAGTTIGT